MKQSTICLEGRRMFKVVTYSVSCRFGIQDCILDPNYIKATYPIWYKSIKDDLSCKNCDNGCLHDDEDK